MSVRFLTLMVFAAVALGGLQGCNACGRRCASPPPCPPPGTRATLLPLRPCQPVPVQPRPAPAGTYLPPIQVPPGDVRSYPPPASTPPDPTWRPSPDPGVRLLVPESGSAVPPRDSARLLAPESVKPGVAEDSPPSPPLPVDIPQFAEARKGVAAGRRPFPDGLDWLKKNGYKTVLYLRKPGQDDSADRRQIEEKRGLKYYSLEVSPQTLAQSMAVDEFNHIVANPDSHPLFVYDEEGALAGGLWYLYFRIIENASDEEARTKAGRLGLKEKGDELHTQMWLAVQNYYSKRQK